MRPWMMERLINGLMRAVTYFVVLVVGYIIFDIVWNGLPAISWEFLTERPRRSGAEGGIFPAIVGTFYLVVGTIIVALPLGMASAVYLSEYARQGRFNRTIRLAIVTLAGVPSIVFGLFGLGLFVYFFGFGQSILAGSLTLACMVLPTIIVSSEEALRAVPNALREGSLALGATKWETIRYNVLPYSIPGMLTGAILGIGRAAGETAPILLTAASFFLPRLPRSIFDEVMALPYHLYILATQHPDTATVRPMQYGTAFVLLALVLGLNLAAIILRSRFRKKFQW
ncbi:MAG: phosphate ABC transporter permease PstA [Candidatus Hydrogenedentota bacterium]